MAKYHSARPSRGNSGAEGITALLFLIAAGIFSWFRNLTPEWRTFVSYTIPFSLLMAFAFAGLFLWRWRQVARLREFRSREQALRANALQMEVNRKEHDLQFRRASQEQAIKALGPLDLEKYVAELFERLGYKTALTPGIGDHGLDVRMVNSDGETEVVQCKQWPKRNSNLVGEPEIRDFYGAMVSENAVRGYFVAPRGFTQEAIRWATGKPLALADVNWLYLKASEANLLFESTGNTDAIETTAIPVSQGVPLCPRHQIPMVRRTATRGLRAGKPFWGCQRYPACSEIINID